MMGAEGHRFGGLLRTLRDGILPLLVLVGCNYCALSMHAVRGYGGVVNVLLLDDSSDNCQTGLMTDNLRGCLLCSRRMCSRQTSSRCLSPSHLIVL